MAVLVVSAAVGPAVAEEAKDVTAEAAALISGKRIKPNSIPENRLNRAVRRKLNRAGTPGPQGPQGAQGPQGGQGPAGPAGSARAVTNVKVDSPQQPSLNRNRGFSSVRSPSPGIYCLTASGLNSQNDMHMAGQWTDGPQFVFATVNPDGGGQQCPLNEFQVNTLDDNGNFVSNVEFWVAVP